MEGVIEFEEVKSTKNKSLLHYAGFDYFFHKASKMDVSQEFYRCSVSHPHCSGRVAVNSTWIVRQGGKRVKRGVITNKNHHHRPKESIKAVGLLSLLYSARG